MRQKSVLTVQQFKEEVREAFRTARLNATVEDVYAKPDYQAFFHGCTDQQLANYTKEEHTQHVWLFKAVDRSEWFLFGCKVMYRAYASDKVIKIKNDLPINVRPRLVI